MDYLTNEIADLYRKLQQTGSSIDNFTKLAIFPTQVGQLYKQCENRMLVIGRCTNGWNHETYMNSEDSFLQYLHSSDSCSYIPNLTNSSFWRVTKRVWNELFSSSYNDDWRDSLAWTNLYRIAPSDYGNPNNQLCESQFKICKELLKLEIEQLKPACILAITGWYGWVDWKENYTFADIFSDLVECKSEQINHIGSFNDIPVVFANRPERKPETPWVNEVVEAFLNPK